MKTFFSLALAITAIVSGFATTAAPVTFWFAGVIDYIDDPDTNRPANIEIGTPFSGRITYDFTNVTQTNLFTAPAGKVANYYFKHVDGCSALLQIGGHTSTNREVLVDGWAGNITVEDNYNNADSLVTDIGQNGLTTEGQVDTNSIISVRLRDSSKTTFVNAGLPGQPPTLGAFPSSPSMNWYRYDDQRNQLFYFGGEITQLSTNELVILNFRRPTPGTVRLSWPIAVAGGLLQSSTNLASPTNWKDVATAVVPVGIENTVTVSTNGPGQFFRLKIH